MEEIKWINVNNKTPELKDRVLLRYRKHKEIVITEGYLTDDAANNATVRHSKEFWERLNYGLCYYDYADRKIQNLRAKGSKNEILHWSKLPNPPID